MLTLDSKSYIHGPKKNLLKSHTRVYWGECIGFTKWNSK